MALELPGQFPSHVLIRENGLGTSSAVSLTVPSQFLLRNWWKVALESPGQFPLHVLIKSLLKWLENCFGASWAVFFTCPYQTLLKTCGKVAQTPPGQFPSHCSGASWAVSFTCLLIANCKFMRMARSFFASLRTFPDWRLIENAWTIALEAPGHFPK